MRGAGSMLFFAAVALAACESLSGLSDNETNPAGDGGADGSSSSSGGTDSGGNTDGAQSSLVEECAKVAAASCARFTACAPSFVSTLWGGPAACETQNRITCESWSAPPGAHVTVADIAKCGADIEAAPCDDILARRVPESCRPRGDFAEGATCVANTQCTTGLCANVESTGCGKCRVPGAENQPCVAGVSFGIGCAAGLVCGSNNTCIVPGGVGANCQGDADCARSLHCPVDNKCAPWRLENQACTGGDGRCAWHLGLSCHPTDNVCVKVPVVSPGMSCAGVVGPICLGGMCRPVNMVPTCTAFAKEGETCVAVPCLDPFQCNAGQCVRAKQSYCP